MIKNEYLICATAIITVLSVLYNQEALAQTTADAFVSNVILTPNHHVITSIVFSQNGNNVEFVTATANIRRQSPFHQIEAGTWNASIMIPEGFKLIIAKAMRQKPNGKWIILGENEGTDTIKDIELIASRPHKIIWTFEEVN